MPEQNFTFLALGDSYTIGESIMLHESFPYQTVQLLRKKGLNFNAPELIAKTGWTTDELLDQISKTELSPTYNIVTLLIGVNNQYRGLAIETYKTEFEIVLKKAISLAANNANHVIVLSIPDWGITPFAADRDQKKIADEIDAYNQINEALTQSFHALYINITGFTREALVDMDLLASDKLHPSGKDYYRWAEKLATEILEIWV